MATILTPNRRFDEKLATAAASAILEKLDAPRRKSEPPIKPLVYEFFGSPKSGKDTQQTTIDQWFRRRGFNVFIRQESAEAEMIRAIPRRSSYEFEMAHFAYNFPSLIKAGGDRNFHLIMLNRGIFDNLDHLVGLLNENKISREQFDSFLGFLFSGEWTAVPDAVFLLTCSVDEALRREYGNSANAVYGLRMNPAFLRNTIESIWKTKEILLARLPHLPVFVIDTTGMAVEETKEEIISKIIEAAEERFKVSEDEVICRNIDLLRERQIIQPPQIKVRGTVSQEKLRNLGWSFRSACKETDTYVTPKNTPPLMNDECFHLRRTNDHVYFVFRWSSAERKQRTKIAVPILPEKAEKIIQEFDVVVTFNKEREYFSKNGFTLTLDAIKELGNFVEIEAPNDCAGVDLYRTIEKLGFSTNDVVPESYLRLYLKTRT
jgi:adenylate cyclase class 2